MSMKPCPETFPYPLIVLDETDSTNWYISQLCNELQESVAELTTVTAEFQTAGKGQRGNTWEAERGKNLLFSFVLYPSFLEARRQFILSQIVSLAIKEELSRWSDEITIKWPNDIIMSGKKVCGILTEMSAQFDYVNQFNEKYKEDGIIWFLECCDLNVMGIRRAMWQMKNAGWFQHVKGFLIGRPCCIGEEMMGLDHYRAVTDILKDFEVPIIMDMDIGHRPPMMPLVCGSMAEVCVKGNDVTIDMKYI